MISKTILVHTTFKYIHSLKNSIFANTVCKQKVTSYLSQQKCNVNAPLMKCNKFLDKPYLFLFLYVDDTNHI